MAISNVTSGLILGAVNFGQLNTEPYNVPTIDNISQSMPDASTVALLPFSMSFKYNTAVSTFYTMGGLGLGRGKYGLKDPFSKSSLLARRSAMYKGTTLRGLIGDTVNAVGKWRSPIEWTTDVGKAFGDVRIWHPGVNPVKASGRSAADLGRTLKAAITPGKDKSNRLARFTTSEAGLSKFMKENPVGMVENYLLHSRNLKRLSESIDPGMLTRLGGKKGLATSILENIQGITPTAKGMGMASTRFGEGTLSLGELLSGTGTTGKRADRLGMIYDNISQKRSKRFVFKGSLSAKDKRIHSQVYEAVLKTMADKSVNPIKLQGSALYAGEMGGAMAPGIIGKDAIALRKSMKYEISEFTTSVVTRLRRARMLKVAGATAMGVGISVAIAKNAFRGLTEVSARLGNTVKGMLRMEFGSGQVLQNAALSTERQRAIQAIQGAQMNARYLMGNEAQMSH